MLCLLARGESWRAGDGGQPRRAMMSRSPKKSQATRLIPSIVPAQTRGAGGRKGLEAVGEGRQRVMTMRVSSLGQKAAIQASSAPHPVHPITAPQKTTNAMCADDAPRRQAMAAGMPAHSMRYAPAAVINKFM